MKVKLNSERIRTVSANSLGKPPTNNHKIDVIFGQLVEKDLHDDRLDMHLKETGDWMFKITESNRQGGLVYSFEEIRETLNYMSVDLSETGWFGTTNQQITYAQQEPTNIDRPTNYLGEIESDFLLNSIQLLPARVDGVKECLICGDDTKPEEDCYCLFGLAPIEFHEHCFYNFIATIQDILDGVEAAIVSKSI